MELIYTSADFELEDDMSDFELNVDNKRTEKALRKIIIKNSYADADSDDTRKILDLLFNEVDIIDKFVEAYEEELKEEFFKEALEEWKAQQDIGEAI